MDQYKHHCMLLGLYLVAAGGTTIYMLGVSAHSNNQLIKQDNPGFNDHCQRPGLSNFDLSICYGSMYVRPEEESSKSDDTKHKRLFLLYADGAPYAYYKSMLDDPKWKGKLVDIPSRVLGSISSAPIFRGVSLGRIDGEFVKDMSMLDNIFGQIYKVAGIQLGLHISYYYPVWHNLGNHTFARVDKVDQFDLESFNSFCREERDQGYIFMDHNETFGCRDFLECSYPDFKTAAAAASTRSAELLNKLKSQQTSKVKTCLDKEVGETGGVMVVAVKGDNQAHKYTMVSRGVVEIHAAMRANFEFTADYLLSKYPDCLVAVFSDHGHVENIALSDWVDHGFEKDDNRGFMLLLSRKFQNKTLRKVSSIQDHITLFSHFAVLLEGVNLPALTERIPHTLFENDPIEKLRILRLKEMQLQYLLAYPSRFSQQDIGSFMKDMRLDDSLTVAQLVDQLGLKQTQSLIQNYESRLQPMVEKAYRAKISELLGNWYISGKMAYVVLLLVLCSVVCVLRLQEQIIPPVSHRALLVGIGVIAAWLSLHILCCSGQAAVFLAMLGVLLPYLKGRTFSVRHIWFLSALHDLDNQSLKFLCIACIALAKSQSLLRLSFDYLLAESHRVNVWLNALSPVGGFAGIFLVSFWTLILVIDACRSQEVHPSFDHSIFHRADHQIREMEQSLLNRDQQIEVRRKWAKSLRIFQVLLVLNLLRLTLQYELKLLRQQSLEHGNEGVTLVWQFYWSFVFSIIASWFGELEFSKGILLALYYINMSFWHNHWSRISYGLILLPACFWIYTKHRALKAEGNEGNRRLREVLVYATLLIAQFGFFRANQEDYALYVNQRALWRLPTATPDDGNYLFHLHILNIKACAACFLLQQMNCDQLQKITCGD